MNGVSIQEMCNGSSMGALRNQRSQSYTAKTNSGGMVTGYPNSNYNV
jgi:hypothetical protein